MIRPLYKKFNLEEATELLDQIRDTIVDYQNRTDIDSYAFHSVAEYVGYNLFILFSEKGLITSEQDKQMSLDGTETLYSETVSSVRRRTKEKSR